MLVKFTPILALCFGITLAYQSLDQDPENVALPGLGLMGLGLKAKVDHAKFRTHLGLTKLSMKGAKKAFHAGALLGAANPNEFEGDDAQSFGAEAMGAYGAAPMGAYGFRGSQFDSPAYGAQPMGAEQFGAYGFKASEFDSPAYGAEQFGASDFVAQAPAFGAYGFDAQAADPSQFGASDFVASPQEFGSESADDESQFRFGKLKKLVLVKVMKEDHDEEHEHGHKHAHKHGHKHGHEHKHEHEGKHYHQHLHYEQGKQGYGGYGHGGYGQGGYGGGHGGYGHGGYGHGGYGGGHGGYGHGGYGHGGGHGGYGHGGYGGKYQHKRDTCGYTHFTDLSDANPTPYEAAVYDVAAFNPSNTEYYQPEPYFSNEHTVLNQQTTMASLKPNERSARCLFNDFDSILSSVHEVVSSSKTVPDHLTDLDDTVALSRSKRDTRPKRTLSQLLSFDGYEDSNLGSVHKKPMKNKKANSKVLYKSSKTNPESILPSLTEDQMKQFSTFNQHFNLDKHNFDSTRQNQYSGKPKTSRQSHSRPFKNLQLNLFDNTPFHKRKNTILDNTRHNLGPAGNSHLPVPIVPAQLVPAQQQKMTGTNVHDLIDQHATHPATHFSHHGGANKIPCPCANGKCELGCECAEPYKQALWNFVQCMQGCIESVLTEIDRIRIADSLKNHQNSNNVHDFNTGKFPRSSSVTDYKNLEKLRNMVQEYRDKLNELEFISKDGFHLHSTYLEDDSQEMPQRSNTIRLNETPFPDYETSSSSIESQSNEDQDDFSGFTDEQIKIILNRFLQHYVDIEKNYLTFKNNLQSTETEQNVESSEEEVQSLYLSELENIKPCDFQSFLKIVFEKLLQKELTYEQLRQLCLNDIKKCIDARAISTSSSDLS